MARTGLDLISMADIARLAGQSRATAGNWKARNPDFPPERGRSPRGPLYDRAEVTRWLESTGRLDQQSHEAEVMWSVAEHLRGDLAIDEALSFALVLLAVISKSSPTGWQEIRQTPPRDLDAVLRSTAVSLLPSADELIPRQALRPESLVQVVELLSQFDRSRASLMADALLEHAAKAMGNHGGGEYLSPPSVRRLIIAIAKPVGSVYNPASGIGQLMIDAAANTGQGTVQLFGQEVNSRIWAMAQLNLAIHDVRADLALGDVFGNDHYPQLRADRVVAVPPWNVKLPIVERLRDDPRWIWGEPGTNDGNAAWIQHCLSHLADGGRAVIVLPSRVLFESGRSGRIRQRIIKAGFLDAVLALPPGLFAWTGLPCAMLVFAKGRPTAAGKPAATLMVDFSKSGKGHTARATTLSDNLIDEAARIYHDWVDGREPTEDYAAVATFDELAANDFVIDPARYIPFPSGSPDLDEAVHDRSELLDRLERLNQASRDADDQLQLILEAQR